MSLLSHAYLLERYGLRLDIHQIAEVLHLSPSTVTNRLAQKKFDIPHYVDGKVWFDYRDVAEHLDEQRKKAREALGASDRAAA